MAFPKSPQARTVYTSCLKRARSDLFTVSFSRKVMKSFTLSDGTLLPKGAQLAAPSMMFDLDPEFYEGPEVFDGFHSFKRNLASEDAGQFDKAQCVTTSSSYLSFSYGKYACPGRFFATDEIKLLLCHLLQQYDIKSVTPYDQWRGD